MNRCCCGWPGLSAWLLVIMTHLLPAASPDARPVFKAGFAQRDISPAVGMDCTFPGNTEPAATGQGVVRADFSTPTGERPSRARRGSPR